MSKSTGGTQPIRTRSFLGGLRRIRSSCVRGGSLARLSGKHYTTARWLFPAFWSCCRLYACQICHGEGKPRLLLLNWCSLLTQPTKGRFVQKNGLVRSCSGSRVLFRIPLPGAAVGLSYTLLVRSGGCCRCRILSLVALIAADLGTKKERSRSGFALWRVIADSLRFVLLETLLTLHISSRRRSLLDVRLRSCPQALGTHSIFLLSIPLLLGSGSACKETTLH